MTLLVSILLGNILQIDFELFDLHLLLSVWDSWIKARAIEILLESASESFEG